MPKYIVANPRGIPKYVGKDRIAIFRQGDREWFEGDVYDGAAPKEPLRRGLIQEVDRG